MGAGRSRRFRGVLALVALGGAGALLLGSACGYGSVCTTDWVSPCPDWVDIGEWCGEHGCEVDGQPAQCQAYTGCNLRSGEVLSIPLDALLGSFAQRDIWIELYSQFCDVDHPFAGSDFSFSVDGVPGTPWLLDGWAVFRWETFPAPASTLTVFYGDKDAGQCLSVSMYFIDGACEAAHPPPDGACGRER